MRRTQPVINTSAELAQVLMTINGHNPLGKKMWKNKGKEMKWKITMFLENLGVIHALEGSQITQAHWRKRKNGWRRNILKEQPKWTNCWRIRNVKTIPGASDNCRTSAVIQCTRNGLKHWRNGWETKERSWMSFWSPPVKLGAQVLAFQNHEYLCRFWSGWCHCGTIRKLRLWARRWYWPDQIQPIS